ncbi:hypothetical protein AN639_11090 [Candidatus Epulonipiscium fishelsonii]|uniref:Uncharacterized protein n=1 Tax=Candidatus Epulonipiscium fishelsonii TaxID=77094 RepID=A0ACC8XCR5_9FIRM|nr:hypothetical protein AN396_05915 [Epulopiscium sp. SCG-B11WGA-EpuloA1]ONI43216.1 hypothetical protein AN639_11090 [Epulopiscium sp. SCG-B05WGA-EpuloA1]
MIKYPNGATKALTFSYDDGVEQDKQLVAIFNKYGLKSTFNLNYGLLDQEDYWEKNGVIIKRLSSEEAKNIYASHEVACHGLMHKTLPELSTSEKEYEISEDKRDLEKLFNRNITGMAYSFGKVDNESISIMKKCNIDYGRVVEPTLQFEIPSDWYRWQPTCHHNHEDIYNLIEKYINLKSEELALFYIWGHSYEFDVDNNWEHIENCAKMLAGRDDIWYCTNKEFYDFITRR